MKTIRINIGNKFEADIFIDIINKNNVPNAVITNHSLAYDGIFEIQKGWGYVEIPSEYERIALKLFDDFKNSEVKKDD